MANQSEINYENIESRLHKEEKSVIGLEILKYLNKYNLVIILGVLILISSMVSRIFISSTSMWNILVQSSIIGCLAIGQTLVRILSGGIDLSVGSILALTCVLSAMSQGYGFFLACLIPIAVGVVLGIGSGFMVVKGKLPPFIATLAMMWIARGLVLTITKGMIIGGVTDNFQFIGSGYLWEIPFPVIIFISVTILGYLFSVKTKQGQCIFAVGGNENAARLSGINSNRIKFIVYSVSGLCAAIGGIVYTGRMTAGQPTAGGNFELDSIAAVVIGGTSIFGGEGSIVKTFIGVIILQILTNLMNLANIIPYYQEAVKGIIILGAVFASIRMGKD